MTSLLEERAWLARVLDPSGGVMGAAFAIDEARLVTCAHVVLDAGAAGPGDTVTVDCPLLGLVSEAEVLSEAWAPEAGTAGDFALLRMNNPPEQMCPVPLRALESLDGLAFTAYGFPVGYEEAGVPTEGIVGKAAELQWVKLEVGSELAVAPGFSGGAVWDEAHERVVALMTVRDTAAEGRVAFAIPVAVLAKDSVTIKDALPTALDLDPDRDIHWGPRSRGVDSDRDDAGWLFSGRRQALCELVAWLTEGPPSLRVVTGPPGSGKSALLGRLVTAADRHYRRRIPDLCGDDSTVPPVDSVDVTFCAHGRTVRQLVDHIGDIAEVRAESSEKLVAALDRMSRRPTVVADAIDEAAEPKDMCRLLNSLAGLGCRVLVACSEYLLDDLSDPSPLRLDRDPNIEVAAIELYVRQVLEQRQPPLRHTKDLAKEIGKASGGNFLVARLIAQTITIGGEVSRPFPREVRQAFDRLLDALPNADTARDFLLPLAYALGDGLPDDLWLSAVGTLRRRYEPAVLDGLLESSAASFLTTRRDAPGGRRHRLFHEALAETLVGDRDQAADHRRLWNAWLADLPRQAGGHRAWTEAPAYLREHAPEHAAKAGTIQELVADSGYLVAGDIRGLVFEALRVPSPRAVDIYATMYLLGDERARELDFRRRSIPLALAAHALGLPKLADEISAHSPSAWRLRWVRIVSKARRFETTGLGGQTLSGLAIGRIGTLEVVVSGSLNGTLQVWEGSRGEPFGDPLDGHEQRVTGIAMGTVAGRDAIVSGSWDKTVRIRDAASGADLCEPLPHPESVEAVALGRVDEREVVVSGCVDGAARIWDARSGDELDRLRFGEDSKPVASVAIGTIDGRELIACAVGEDVWLWDALAKKGLGKLGVGDPQSARRASRSPTVNAVAMGRFATREVFVSGCSDGTVRRWHAKTGQLLGLFNEPLVAHSDLRSSVAELELGRIDDHDVIVSASWDGTVQIWAADSPTAPQVFDTLGPCLGLALSPRSEIYVADKHAICCLTSAPMELG